MMALVQQLGATGDECVRSETMLQILTNGDSLTPRGSELSSSPSPKVTRAEKRSLIYPYYAGFSEAFAASMLHRMDVAENSRVLDPWNGSGTTTLIGSIIGACCTGYDLNPALVIAARARAANAADLISANLAWEKLNLPDDPADADPVEQCAALYECLTSRNTAEGHNLTPAAHALILCALFKTLRQSFQYARTRNPAWFSSDIKSLSRQPFCQVATAAKDSFTCLVEQQARYGHFLRRVPQLHTGDFSDFPVTESSVDVVLTSPPYLTRLDYVKATLPELLLLNRLCGLNIVQLRFKMMGSPLVGKDAPPEDIRWGPTALRLIHKVKALQSKASSTYYLRFYLKYFAALYKGIERIAVCLVPNGLACLVSQRSHYKEISIDLSQIIIEMSNFLGLRVRDRLDFPWNKSIAIVNSRALKANNNTIETAVILKKS
jgi:tRNA G10  N-methylase Trm11